MGRYKWRQGRGALVGFSPELEVPTVCTTLPPRPEFANQCANQLRDTAWHRASRTGIVVGKMQNQSTRLATAQH